MNQTYTIEERRENSKEYTFEQIASHLRSMILTNAISLYAFDSWTKDTFKQGILCGETSKYVITEKHLRDTPLETLKSFGFSSWEEPDEKGNFILLIPFWLRDMIDPDTIVAGITGGQGKYGEFADTEDHRFDCLADGIIWNIKGNTPELPITEDSEESEEYEEYEEPLVYEDCESCEACELEDTAVTEVIEADFMKSQGV